MTRLTACDRTLSRLDARAEVFRVLCDSEPIWLTRSPPVLGASLEPQGLLTVAGVYLLG